MGENGISVADALALRNSGNGNDGNGNGWGDGNSWWIIVFVLLIAFGGWGRGGYGNGGGSGDGCGVNTVVVPTGGFGGFGGGYNACCTPATQQGLTDAFNFNQLDNGQRGLERGLCDGFYSVNLGITNLGTQLQQGFCASDRANLQSFNGLQSTLCQGFNGIQSSIADTNYAIKDCCCETGKSIMQSNFNTQSGFNAIQNQLASCCCDLSRGQENIKYALAQATCDITTNADKNTDRIINHLVQNELDGLRNELQSAQFQLSQLSQTDRIVNRLQPVPVPSYPVSSPYASIFGCSPYGINFGGNACNSCC